MLSTRLMGSLSPPDLRKLLDDALDKPELQKPLTEAAYPGNCI